MRKSKDGFTLIEILVTLVVLTAGIVAIFQTYLISLDQIDHLTYRLYATTILDNQISSIERVLRAHQALPLELTRQEEVSLGHRTAIFDQELKITQVEEYLDVFEIEVTLSWKENGRPKTVSRYAYISNFSMDL